IEQFIPPADSVAVSAVLIDELRDGYFKVESRDIEGFVGRQRVDVPGYTLRVMDTAGTVEVVKRHAHAAGLRRTYCQDYFLVNTGRFDQTVKNLRMASTASAYTLLVPPLPLSVKPGDTIPFTMCYRFDAEGDYLDTVLVDMGCGPRTLITSTVVAGEDTSGVRITYQDNDCRSQRTILLREDARFQTGVRDITVKDSTNCTFSIAFNAVRTRMTATIGNTDQDAWYTLVVTDSVGNTAMLTDTIEGFTIRYAGVGTPATKRLRSAAFLGESVDTIVIENYGAFAKSFDDLPMRQNQLFSIPQHQLPFVVKPGERKEVEIRYSMTRYPPFADSVWRDTLDIRFGCYVKSLPFVAGVVPTDAVGDTRCDVGVVTRQGVTGVLRATAPYPQPGGGRLRMQVMYADGEPLQLRCVDTFGRSWIESTVTTFGDTATLVDVDVSTLPSGVYAVELRGDGIVASFPYVILR
ncbi:MAG: hypothetical protein ACKOAG_11945, partial [Candidatus Kapaibacterium sp.]